MISDSFVFIYVLIVDSSSKLELIQVSVYYPPACTLKELPPFVSISDIEA